MILFFFFTLRQLCRCLLFVPLQGNFIVYWHQIRVWMMSKHMLNLPCKCRCTNHIKRPSSSRVEPWFGAKGTVRSVVLYACPYERCAGTHHYWVERSFLVGWRRGKGGREREREREREKRKGGKQEVRNQEEEDQRAKKKKKKPLPCQNFDDTHIM